ncbi:MAG TPA: DUF1460 domain-containing protein [Syntrophorhabdaceae bacterium]|nr:DUF1460 domain-containing protein [Syntrophorhabdaceae bacterium]HQM81002.1 DUF1460 domain-containing protein [Syntrophorhabdaceae bacterium]
MNEKIVLGKWTEERLDRLIAEGSGIADAGERIEFLSRQFLGTPYREGTLIGDAREPEVFVVDLHEVDCFTLLDYIEAMRRSPSFGAFKENLVKVRYRDGAVSHHARNHFFTDWRRYNENFIEDVTGQFSPFWSRKVQKMLNRKEDGTLFVKGVAPALRTLSYIPADTINSETTDSLRTGDYIGIYTDAPGLDVTHVGIFIRKSGVLYLRHASSAKGVRQVTDQGFMRYIATKPGIIVLRPMA